MVYTLNKQPSGSPIDFLQLFPVSPHHSTSTEPGLDFQVPVKGILPVSCAASTDPHCSKTAEFSHQALALLKETFGPSSWTAFRQVWEEQSRWLCASCSVSAVVGFQQPLPLPHHVQGGAAAAPGQGQSWPLCVAPVLCHLRADSLFLATNLLVFPPNLALSRSWNQTWLLVKQ